MSWAGREVAAILGAAALLGIAGTNQLPADADAGRDRSSSCEASVDGFSDEQVANAATIAEVGRDMDMPDRAIVVALATAMQESGLRNLDYGDRDSLGLFQQRPSQGWGTRRQVTDPEHASRSFYRSLRQVDGWQDMRVTEAAQAVQISAFPEAYQKHADDAERLAEAVEGCG
jgi:hypothetical protein